MKVFGVIVCHAVGATSGALASLDGEGLSDPPAKVSLGMGECPGPSMNIEPCTACIDEIPTRQRRELGQGCLQSVKGAARALRWGDRAEMPLAARRGPPV
jgi:hypothetical protein